ncbi:hypothetical protein [Rosenbergiella epipactidis]|uniref:hypothetical protein n=1 Tax=Rosenbergiella epipactidis TaxID=1544694 RepID=UPI001F4D7482|nr:hypothetical protein [Rosenbergiella epipactidis]
MSNWEVKSDPRLMENPEANADIEKAANERNKQPVFKVKFGQIFLNPAKIGLIRGFN